MKVLVKRPRRGFEFETIDNDLKAMQKLVGGYIESHSLENGLYLICNEDGKDLMPNAAVKGALGRVIHIRGIFFICAVDGYGEMQGLEDYEDARALGQEITARGYGGV